MSDQPMTKRLLRRCEGVSLLYMTDTQQAVSSYVSPLRMYAVVDSSMVFWRQPPLARLHSLVCILIPVSSPRSVFYTDRDRITTLLCQILIDKKLIGKVLSNIFSYISPQIHSTFIYYLVH